MGRRRDVPVNAAWAVPILIGLALTGCGDGGGEAGATATRLDPELYRSDLEDVEAVLFKEEPADYGDGDRVSAALYRAAGRAMAADCDPASQARARVLVAFAGEAGAMEDAGYAMPDLGSLRARWHEVRGEVFDEAEWFREADAGLAARQRPVPPRADAGAVRDVERVIERLTDLVRRGRRDVEELGEPIYALELIGREGEAQIAGWRAWSRRWDEQLTGLARQLPPAPGLDDDGNYLVAYQNVAQALGALRHVPLGAGAWPTPFRYQWEERFELAERQLAAAGERLAYLR
jgi:hypothetical protein